MRQVVLRGARYFKNSEDPWKRGVFETARSTYRWTGRSVPGVHFGWTSSLRTARWDAGDLVLTGWAYHRGTDMGARPSFRIWLVRGLARIEVPAESIVDPDARGAARGAEFDYGTNAFRARLSAATLAALAEGEWRLRAEISGNGQRITGPVDRAYVAGSAWTTPMHALPDGSRVGPLVVDEGQFRVARWTPLVHATSVELLPGRTITVRLEGADEPELTTVLGPYEPGEDDDGTRPTFPILATRDGREVPIAFSGLEVGHSLLARPDQTGALSVIESPAPVMVEDLRVEGHLVRVSGRALGGERPRLGLVSGHVTIGLDATWDASGSFTATGSLRQSRWGGPELPVPTGDYVLRTIGTGRVDSTFAAPELVAAAPQRVTLPEFRLRIATRGRDQMRVVVARPREESEYGSFQQGLLKQRFALAPTEPLEAVYFESFFGRNATCNPRGVDAEIARRYPDLPRYWAVADLSIEVPPGAIPLVRGTTDWWRVRESAKWVVTNEWLRASFVKKPFQTVLQTWHGSMYKRIGLDRDARGKGAMLVVEAERRNWDLFLSQAAETTPIIRRAYAMDEAVIETGYPRNDELLVPPADLSEIKRRIGIPESAFVVMYAPTWREPGQEDVELLDLPRLAKALGDDFVLLQRGHVRTLGTTEAVRDKRVIDVGTYPQLGDLFHVTDLLVTDYSSMMFDFSVTAKPMLFFTPDIDQYTDAKVRGSYFDLEERAPGPVTRAVGDVADLIRTAGDWHPTFTQKYDAWRAMYNHLDDGHASQRAVDALFSFRGGPDE